MHALIHQLARRFALDDGRTQRLWALSGLHRRPDALATHLHRGLAVLAALLLGAGLIFWVAANWQDQTRAFKLHLLEGAVLASAGAALLWPRGRTARPKWPSRPRPSRRHGWRSACAARALAG